MNEEIYMLAMPDPRASPADGSSDKVNGINEVVNLLAVPSPSASWTKSNDKEVDVASMQ